VAARWVSGGRTGSARTVPASDVVEARGSSSPHPTTAKRTRESRPGTGTEDDADARDLDPTPQRYETSHKTHQQALVDEDLVDGVAT
jgi:hypothetical protein